MNTLLEFLEFTKGTSYLIAVAFLLGFIAFWQLMQFRGKRLATRIIPLAILVLGLSGLLFTSITSKKPAEPPILIGEEPLLSAEILTEMYGPAPFDHVELKRFLLVL